MEQAIASAAVLVAIINTGRLIADSLELDFGVNTLMGIIVGF
jgi:hypothetical protein